MDSRLRGNDNGGQMTKEQRGRLFVNILYALCAGIMVPWAVGTFVCLVTGHSAPTPPSTVAVTIAGRYGRGYDVYVTPQVAALHNLLNWVCFGSLAILLAIGGIGCVIRMIVALKTYRARIQ
jgi:hypothetical protein